MSKTQHFVYVLRCGDGTFYTGYATDVERRLKEHNGEIGKTAARYTRGRRPLSLIHKEVFKTRGEALKREAAIKKLSRSEKETLVTS